MLSMFDDIKRGINEAIEYEKGNVKANVKTLSVTPIEKFTATEIENIMSIKKETSSPPMLKTIRS